MATTALSHQPLHSPRAQVQFISLPAECSTRSPKSSASSTSEDSDSSDSEVSTVANEESSEDDEDGIFFGAHDEVEADLLAKLSTTPPTSSSSILLDSPRGSLRPRSVRKRDSREFLRRKTLLLCHEGNSPKPTTPNGDKEKVWDGGFYEKTAQRPRVIEEMSDDEFSTPPAFSSNLNISPSKTTNQDDHCDLTLDFSRFRLSDHASSPISTVSALRPQLEPVIGESDEEEAEEEDELTDTDDDSYEGDSDKENNAVPMSPVSSDEQVEDVGVLREELPVVFGLKIIEAPSGTVSDDEDSAEQLDMGGLRLADFDDPEVGFEENAGTSHSEEIDFGGYDSDEQSVLDESVCHPEDVEDDSTASIRGDQVSEGVEVEALEKSSSVEVEEIIVEDLEDVVLLAPFIAKTATDGTAELHTPHQGPLLSEETPSLEELANFSKEIQAGILGRVNSPTPTTELDVPTLLPTPQHRADTELPSQTPLDAAVSPSHEEASFTASDGLDSPIPIMRGGPVVIPQLSHLAYTMRAETGSPHRSLPASSPQTNPSADLAVMPDDDATVRLAALDSPSSVPPPEAVDLQTTPLTTRPHVIPASTSNSRTPLTNTSSIGSQGLGAATKSEMLKSSLASSTLVATSVDRPKAVVSTTIDKNAAARAASIRSQLDSAFALRQNVMGPPQRTASSSSSASSHSQAGPGRPPSRSGATVSARGQAKMKVSTSEPNRPATTRATMPTASSWSKSQAGSSKPILAVNRTGKPAGSTLAQSTSRPSAVPVTSSFSKSATYGSTRQPLAPRTIPPTISRTAAPNPPLSRSTAKPLPLQAVKTFTTTKPAQISPPSDAVSANPLKRPLPTSQPTLARSLVAATGQNPNRPTFGPPTRIVSGGSGHLFSVGVGGGDMGGGFGPSRGFRSPGRMGAAKRTGGSPTVAKKLGTPLRIGTPSHAGAARSIGILGTPSRNGTRTLGTPSRKGLPSRAQPTILATAPAQTAQSNEEATHLGSAQEGTTRSSQKDGTATASEVVSTTRSGTPIRGSSEDQEDVSFQLAPESSELGSSPLSNASASRSASRLPRPVSQPQAKEDKDKSKSPSPEEEVVVTIETSARPKRASKATTPGPSRGKSTGTATATGTIVPKMSEKELKATTQRNTSRNEVYHCAIDRQIIRKDGPRPPSPTSKIRTVADRDEAEKKAGRGERAKRRSRGSDGAETESVSDAAPHFPLVERVQQPRGPGDDEDYVTPARPNKKAKTAHRAEKNVKWDRGLLVHRDDGSSIESKEITPSCEAAHPTRSALKETEFELDGHGNIIESRRPQEALKRHRIVVTAVFYDGEDPVPVAAYASTLPPTNASKGTSSSSSSSSKAKKK